MYGYSLTSKKESMSLAKGVRVNCKLLISLILTVSCKPRIDYLSVTYYPRNHWNGIIIPMMNCIIVSN